MSPCAYFEQMRQLPEVERIMTDERGNDWTSSYFATCYMSYMDKEFYKCLLRNNVQSPTDLIQEFEKLRQSHSDGTPIHSSELDNADVMSISQFCFSENEKSIRDLQDRTAELSNDIAKRHRAYQDFTIMVHGSKNKLLDDEPESESMKKIQNVKNGVCKLPVNLNEIEQPNANNVLRYGMMNTDMAYCLVANLCSDQVKQCMDSSPDMTFARCLEVDPHDGISQCSNRLAALSKKLAQQS